MLECLNLRDFPCKINGNRPWLSTGYRSYGIHHDTGRLVGLSVIRDVVLLPKSLRLNLVSRFQNDDFYWWLVIKRNIKGLQRVTLILLRRSQCWVVIEYVLPGPDRFRGFELENYLAEVRYHIFFSLHPTWNLHYLLPSFYFSFNVAFGSVVCEILEIW